MLLFDRIVYIFNAFRLIKGYPMHIFCKKVFFPNSNKDNFLIMNYIKTPKNLLAAAIKLECILKVIKGSGRFLKKVLAALVIVLVSNSIGSSKLSFSDFFLSSPAEIINIYYFRSHRYYSKFVKISKFQ